MSCSGKDVGQVILYLIKTSIKMKLTYLLFALLLSTMSFNALAQDSVVISEDGANGDLDNEPDVRDLTFRERLMLGGGISGLSFGNPTSIGVSPMVGYMATNTTVVGVGMTYQYFAYKGMLASNLLGERIFVRQYIPALSQLLGQSFLTAQVENFSDITNPTYEYSNPVLVGVGIGSKYGINLNVLYDLNYSASKTSPYGSALVVQVGGFFF